MKTSKRIMVLAEDTRLGNRASAHQEFRAVVAANGYEMARGGRVTFGGEYVTRGWENFAYEVLSGEIVLQEPATLAEPTAGEATAYEVDKAMAAEAIQEEISEAANEFPYPTRGLIPAVDAILDRRAASAHTADIVYFYTTRTQTVPLTDLTELTVVIADEATPGSEGPCQSGAALNCTGTGVRRILPESLLGDSIGEDMVQCVPCFEASAAAYVRKAPHYTAPEA